MVISGYEEHREVGDVGLAAWGVEFGCCFDAYQSVRHGVSIRSIISFD